MATLFQVDADVEFHSETRESYPQGVPARPTGEIFTEDTLVDLPPPRASLWSWIGLLTFVGVMVSIITAAGVVAVRERVGDGAFDAFVRSTFGSLPGLSDRRPAASRSEHGAETSARELALVPESRAESPVTTASAAIAAQKPAPVKPAPVASVAAVAPAQPAAEKNAQTLVLEEVALAEKPRGEAAPRGKAERVKRAARPAPTARSASQPAANANTKKSDVSWEAAREAAREHYAAGRFAEAVRAYEDAVRANPNHALTLAGLGAARLQTGDLAGAADAYRRAVRQAPSNVSLQVALARVYERQGDRQAARTIYQRVLASDPNHAGARAALERL